MKYVTAFFKSHLMRGPHSCYFIINIYEKTPILKNHEFYGFNHFKDLFLHIVFTDIIIIHHSMLYIQYILFF